ncbi:hypothetical protein FMM05_14690 [Flavobacterium zepuense]|uniref:Lipoprotein n=1 Tax=Flavobacterium zepuense TaxID=2593302 RepID=A0A552UXI5_9FLAO|nr:DUF6252 family protein [Flavobacterium zepuense]TRW22944.1 hypothetical protein FMM05_14690 [Flavobacterium zepuense]
MNRIKLLSAFMVLFTAIGFMSCDVEPIDPVLLDYEPPVEEPIDSTDIPEVALFQVDFNDTTYVATSTAASVGNGLTLISGMRGTNGEMIGIIIDGTTSGTYTDAIMSYTASGAAESTYSNFLLPEGSSTVTISINTLSHTMSGTFSFTGQGANAEDTKQFTQGVFTDVPYITAPVLPNGDSMTATVNGTAVNYANDLAIGYTNIISINAIGADHQINLFINGEVTPGTYAFSTEPLADYQADYIDDAGVEYGITGGTLVITAIDNGWITGTFTFNVLNGQGETIHTVTNGAFHVEYDW